MTLIDPPPLDRYSPQSEIVDWIKRLKSFEPDEYGMRDFYSDVAARYADIIDQVATKAANDYYRST